MPCQIQIIRHLQSHALLNLEMSQVQRMNWCMKQNSVKDLISTHVWFAEKDEQQFVGSIPTGGNYPLDVNFVQNFQQCQICVT